MKYFTLKIIIAVSIATTIMTACNKQTTNLNQLDLEKINFESDLNTILSSGKYIIQEKSELDNIPKYYTYNLDSLRYGSVVFSTGKHNKYSHSKHGELDDVFDSNENINRIDVFPSADGENILGIALIINVEDETEELLSYLQRKTNSSNEWTKEDKTYILKNETWQVDDMKMNTLSLFILVDKDLTAKISIQ